MQAALICTFLGYPRRHYHRLAGCGAKNGGEVGEPSHAVTDRLVSTLESRRKASSLASLEAAAGIRTSWQTGRVDTDTWWSSCSRTGLELRSEPA